MNGYNFTERVRKVLAMAREEAHQLHHEYVGTEHILLGLVREGEGVAAAVIHSLAIDPDEIIQAVKDTVKKGKPQRGTGPDLPYTSRAKKVLEFAMSEARELNHSYVGTEHLLLGILREEKGIGAQVLIDTGITIDEARSEVLRLLGTDASQSSTIADRDRWLGTRASREHEESRERTARWIRSLPPTRWTSDRAQAVIGRARTDAAHRHSRHIEPEHLLIALVQETGGMAATVLERLGTDRNALAHAAAGAVEETLATDDFVDLDIGFSEPARAVLRHAFHEARITRDRLGTDHLLVGLLLEESSPASRVLADAGLSAEAVRAERARISG